jgi:hypothetical protein
MDQEPDSDGDGQDVKGGKGDKGDKKGVINRVNRKSFFALGRLILTLLRSMCKISTVSLLTRLIYRIIAGG